MSMATSLQPSASIHGAEAVEIRASSADSEGTFAELHTGASGYFGQPVRSACCPTVYPQRGVQTGIAPFLPAKLCLTFVFPMSSKPKSREAELNFESAMDRLEKIVEQMESGKLPLEDLIVRYEEGMNLVKICQERLANAEQKIEIIARDSAGKPVIKEFEPAEERAAPEKTVAESDSTNDEIKLF
jgi:exodeoxyribonuclease VII small subunit